MHQFNLFSSTYCYVAAFASLLAGQQVVFHQFFKHRSRLQHTAYNRVHTHKDAALRICGLIAWVYQYAAEERHVFQSGHLCIAKLTCPSLRSIFRRLRVEVYLIEPCGNGRQLSYLPCRVGPEHSQTAVGIFQRVAEVPTVNEKLSYRVVSFPCCPNEL